MIWLVSSVWRERKVSFCGLGSLGWGASIMMRLPSPGWSSRMPSGSARDCLQCNWQFRPECAQCSALEESTEHAFFHSSVLRPLCKLLEGFMVRILSGKFFVLEVSCVCSDVVPKLNIQEHYVFLCLFGIMCVAIWMTRQKELCDNESFFFQTLVSFYKHQIKVKIWSERRRLSSLEFGKRWVTVACLCHMVGASLTFSLNITEVRDHSAKVVLFI